MPLKWNYEYLGKSYCYGGTEGEYCHCDYCKCKHGFGEKGYKGGCGHKWFYVSIGFFTKTYIL